MAEARAAKSMTKEELIYKAALHDAERKYGGKWRRVGLRGPAGGKVELKRLAPSSGDTAGSKKKHKATQPKKMVTFADPPVATKWCRRQTAKKTMASKVVQPKPIVKAPPPLQDGGGAHPSLRLGVLPAVLPAVAAAAAMDALPHSPPQSPPASPTEEEKEIIAASLDPKREAEYIAKRRAFLAKGRCRCGRANCGYCDAQESAAAKNQALV